MEQLELPGHVPGRLLLKHLTSAARLPRPAFTVDPLREIVAYRDILPSVALDTPRYIASDTRPGTACLVIELVDGHPLWQAPGLRCWEAAARWLASLHAVSPPALPGPIRYDAAEIRRRIELARWMPGVTQVAALVAERLARLPRCLVHGEFYPANVLVDDSSNSARIRPVDWETIGIGPAVLDLAALTAGWDEAARRRIEDSYRAACPPAARPDEADIDLARLVLAAQWSGWSEAWTAPPEQRRDWRAELRELTGRISP